VSPKPLALQPLFQSTYSEKPPGPSKRLERAIMAHKDTTIKYLLKENSDLKQMVDQLKREKRELQLRLDSIAATNGLNGTEGMTASPMTTSAPMKTMDTPMDTMETQLETQTVIEMECEMVGHSQSHRCGPESRYTRKTCTEMVVKLWRVLKTLKDFHKSQQELHQKVSNQMVSEFNVKLNDNRINQLIQTAIDDKLIIAEETDDSQIRYVANFDRQLFGRQRTDWLCFECHLASEDPVLIGCTTCFRAFHLQCLKVKVNPNGYECGYCERLVQRDTTLKVNQIPKALLNKCICLLLNNLELSFDSQMTTDYEVDSTPRAQVFVFKAMHLATIREKATNAMYDSLQEMVNDFKHFLHNYMVCVDSEFKRKLKEVVELDKKFTHEVKELTLYVDCCMYSLESSSLEHIQHTIHCCYWIPSLAHMEPMDCPICDDAFTTSETLILHLQTNHPMKKCYSCPTSKTVAIYNGVNKTIASPLPKHSTELNQLVVQLNKHINEWQSLKPKCNRCKDVCDCDRDHYSYVILECDSDNTDDMTAISFEEFLKCVRYPGKGINDRIADHFRPYLVYDDDKPISALIREMAEKNKSAITVKCGIDLTEREAFIEETLMINANGLHNLCNVINGHTIKGLEMTAEERRQFGSTVLYKGYQSLQKKQFFEMTRNPNKRLGIKN
ncbi:unnamed protein product, partial [Oppiella nova]